MLAENQANRPYPLSLCKKSPQSFSLEIVRLPRGEIEMRIAATIFAGSIAALTLLASPALAKHTEP
jgi:hypothetical protein